LTTDETYIPVFNSLLQHLEKNNYHFDTGILGTPLLLKVLAKNGRHDVIYKLMNQKDFPGFGYLTDPKNSTLWETWNGEGSKSHPMFGSVVEWFYSGIAGIKVDNSPNGMKHFVIEPQTLSDLTYCKSSYHTLFGEIRSEWNRDTKGKTRFVIEVPGNTSATFILPNGMQRVKSEDGRTIKVEKIGDKYQSKFRSGVYKFELL